MHEHKPNTLFRYPARRERLNEYMKLTWNCSLADEARRRRDKKKRRSGWRGGNRHRVNVSKGRVEVGKDHAGILTKNCKQWHTWKKSFSVVCKQNVTWIEPRCWNRFPGCHMLQRMNKKSAGSIDQIQGSTLWSNRSLHWFTQFQCYGTQKNYRVLKAFNILMQLLLTATCGSEAQHGGMTVLRHWIGSNKQISQR